MQLFEVFREVVDDLVDRIICFLRRHETTIPHDELVAKLKHDGKLVE
jgi:hypothetical protein